MEEPKILSGLSLGGQNHIFKGLLPDVLIENEVLKWLVLVQ